MTLAAAFITKLKRFALVVVEEEFGDVVDVTPLPLFGLLHRHGFGNNLFDRFELLFLVSENIDGVSVALAHFLTVDTRNGRDVLVDAELGEFENLAVGVVEADRDIAGDLDMLDLVFADGYDIGIEKQDIRRHEHGVGEETVVGADPFGDFVLVAVGTFQQAHGRKGGERPVEFQYFVDVALYPEGRFFRIDAQGEKVRGGLHRQFREAFAVGQSGHGMVVGDKGENLVVGL